MSLHNLTTDTIASAFEDVVASHDGQIKEVVNDGSHLFVRSLLPYVDEVEAGDLMQGGVALRASESDICLHPFLFREVCQNGAIMAHCIESWEVEYSQYASEFDVIQSLTSAFEACSDANVFKSNMNGVRASLHADVDVLLNMAPLMRHLGDHFGGEVLAEIIREFSTGSRRSQYGLMNAVTAVARETSDPDQRWRLEEVGGGIGAKLLPGLSEDRDRSRVEIHDLISAGAT